MYSLLARAARTCNYCLLRKTLPRPVRTLSEILSKNYSQSNSSQWPLNCIQVNACSELYQKWHELKITNQKPLRGLDFDVVYLDTWPSAPPDVPVILALHGIGCSHQVIVNLIPHLLKDRVRIVAPNFPGCGLTAMDPGEHFSHSDQEKASFVLDFLQALDITRVQMLISHSAAVYPSTYLMDVLKGIKCLVLIMPAPMEPLTRFWRQMNFYLFATEMLRTVGLKVLSLQLKKLMLWLDSSSNMTLETADSGVKSLVYVNFEHCGKILARLSFANLPILLLYSTDDHFIGPQVQTVIDCLYIQPNSVTRYDTSMNIKGPPSQPQDRSYAIVFESGKHAIEKVHSKVIGEAISELFKFVSNKPRF